MIKLMLAGALVLFPCAAFALTDEDLWGTWRLVGAVSKEVDTGATSDAYGRHPTGFITYGKDHRVMAMASYDDRIKPQNWAASTPEERAQLFSTFWAYAGTYKLNGTTVEHHVDTSWNEVWTGTTVIRDVLFKDNQLILTTRPQPRIRDGKMNVVTLTWEKVN